MPTTAPIKATNPSLQNSYRYMRTQRPKNMGASTVNRQPMRKQTSGGGGTSKTMSMQKPKKTAPSTMYGKC